LRAKSENRREKKDRKILIKKYLPLKVKGGAEVGFGASLTIAPLL
jgi:hypothetical protein